MNPARPRTAVLLVLLSLLLAFPAAARAGICAAMPCCPMASADPGPRLAPTGCCSPANCTETIERGPQSLPVAAALSAPESAAAPAAIDGSAAAAPTSFGLVTSAEPRASSPPGSRVTLAKLSLLRR